MIEAYFIYKSVPFREISFGSFRAYSPSTIDHYVDDRNAGSEHREPGNPEIKWVSCRPVFVPCCDRESALSPEPLSAGLK